jgi:hypothetical protein
MLKTFPSTSKRRVNARFQCKRSSLWAQLRLIVILINAATKAIRVAGTKSLSLKSNMGISYTVHKYRRSNIEKLMGMIREFVKLRSKSAVVT